MKKTISIIIGLFSILNLAAQNNTYYWYNGQKQYLEITYLNEFVLLNGGRSKIALEQELGEQGPVSVRKISEKTFNENLISSEPKTYTWAIIDKNRNAKINIESLVSMEYQAPFFITNNGIRIGVSHLFYVKLKTEGDIANLQNLANETDVEILRQDRFMPIWYTLACTKHSKGNAVEMANFFFESGHFAAAEPNFIDNLFTTSVDDEHFDDQWGLDNTGQYGGTSGIDINISEAWDITYGDNNITIAVVDEGIESNHPDLTSLSAYSYDTQNESSPSTIRGEHGMSVSGIISADANNSDGVAGIASGCLLMTISDNFIGLTLDDQQEIAAGIEYAVDNGADVINCSWGFGVSSTYIDDALDDALDYGRGGLGCVVVFATGNFETDVAYPANYDPDIIAVGAMNQIGKRKSTSSSWDTETGWGSNYGPEVDLGAPGVLIPTLDLQSYGYNPGKPLHEDWGGTLTDSEYADGDYTMQFNGTSSAAPHVSGVAALVLSANNGLTNQDVADIMESTAQKVGGYTYHTQFGRSNGLWHQYVGYGLVDAGESVKAAVCDHTIEDTEYSEDITISDCSSVDMENVTVSNNATLKIQDVGSITISGPFEAEIGTTLNFD